MTDSLREQLQASLGAAYVLESELGGGGMSRVFLAEEVRFRRKVVVKVLAPQLAAALSAERFEREISLAAALQEPHIVPVLTAGALPDGLPYYLCARRELARATHHRTDATRRGGIGAT